MFYYKITDECIIVRRHILLFIWWFIKFIFFLLVALILYIIYINNILELNWDYWYIKDLLFLLIFIFVQSAFLKIIFTLIDFYHNLIIVQNDQIIIISCTLLLKDDIEIIDSYRVMKIDTYSHGLFSNLLWYWNLVIEQQKNDVRTFRFIPKPYIILKILKKQKETVLDDRRKKYIISKDI